MGLIVTKRLVNYFKDVGLYFAASFIPMLLKVAVNPLIALNMSPEDYGLTGYFTSFTSLISPIILFYLLHYFNKRFFELQPEERIPLKALIFKALIGFSFIVAVLCFWGLYVYIKCSDTIYVNYIFPFLIFVVFSIPLTGIYSLELADFKMSRNPKGYFKLAFSVGLLTVIADIFFVVIIKQGAFGKMLSPLVCNLIVFLYLIIRHKDLLKIKSSFKEFLPVLKFCWPLALGAMLGYFSQGYDKTFLSSIGDTVEYGNYIVGNQMAGYLSVFGAAIYSTFQPDIYENIIKKNNRKLIGTVLLQLLFVSVIILLFVFCAPLIIKILTAGRYMDSTVYAQIISVSVLSSTIYYIINDYTIATGHPNFYLYTTIIGSVLIIVLMPIVVNCLGYKGGALMVVVSYVLLAVTNVFVLLCYKLFRRWKL